MLILWRYLLGIDTAIMTLALSMDVTPTITLTVSVAVSVTPEAVQ